jgi:hypothetical protein
VKLLSSEAQVPLQANSFFGDDRAMKKYFHNSSGHYGSNVASTAGTEKKALRRSTIVVFALCTPVVWIANLAHWLMTIGAMLMIIEGHTPYLWIFSGYFLMVSVIGYKTYAAFHKKRRHREHQAKRRQLSNRRGNQQVDMS